MASQKAAIDETVCVLQVINKMNEEEQREDNDGVDGCGSSDYKFSSGAAVPSQ